MKKNAPQASGKVHTGRGCGIGGPTNTPAQPKGRSARLAAHRAKIKANGSCPDAGAGHICPKG